MNSHYLACHYHAVQITDLFLCLSQFVVLSTPGRVYANWVHQTVQVGKMTCTTLGLCIICREKVDVFFPNKWQGNLRT